MYIFSYLHGVTNKQTDLITISHPFLQRCRGEGQSQSWVLEKPGSHWDRCSALGLEPTEVTACD